MDRILQRVHLPAEVQAWEVELKLKKWMDSSEWASKPRFAMVDHVRGCWDSVEQPDMADHPLTIVGSLYQYLVKDQEFIDVVIKKRDHLVTSPADWNEIAKAYAWLILQRYNRELEQGGDT